MSRAEFWGLQLAMQIVLWTVVAVGVAWMQAASEPDPQPCRPVGEQR